MPKHDAFTPKAIANKAKSKGLQRLRWYCQMCGKQCRDENGFKCHMSSEGHLRQMRLFAENPNSFIDEFSKDFEKGYLETLSHRHGTKRVAANRVYQEYIAHKEHIHMNATCWSNLTTFCMHLGREGRAVVDETDKGWFVQYIDRDPLVLRRQEQEARRKQSTIDDEEFMRRMMEAQLSAAREIAADEDTVDAEDGGEAHALKRSSDDDKPVVVTMAAASNSDSAGSKKRNRLMMAASGFDEDEDGEAGPKPPSAPASSAASSSSSLSSSSSAAVAAAASAPAVHRRSNIEQLIYDEEQKKARQLQQQDAAERKENWLHRGIVVKILNKTLLEGSVYKKKAVVERVKDKFVGELRLISSSNDNNNSLVLCLDQAELETVIPKEGNNVMIVNGRGRGSKATLLQINDEKLTCTLRVLEGSLHGRELFNVEFEDISKIATK